MKDLSVILSMGGELQPAILRVHFIAAVLNITSSNLTPNTLQSAHFPSPNTLLVAERLCEVLPLLQFDTFMLQLASNQYEYQFVLLNDTMKLYASAPAFAQRFIDATRYSTLLAISAIVGHCMNVRPMQNNNGSACTHTNVT